MKTCPGCGLNNNDAAFRCIRCGAELAHFHGEAPDFQNNQNQFYNPYINQNPYAMSIRTSKGKIITFLVLGIILGGALGMIGLPFAVTALAAFTEYQKALSQGEMMTAERKKETAEKFGKISMILSIIGAVITVMVFITYFSLIISLLSGGLLSGEFFGSEALLSVSAALI